MPEHKEGVVPRLRFPEFRNAEEWEVKRLGDKDVALFVRDTATRKDLCLETYVSTENMLPDFGGVTRATSLPPSGTIRKYQKRDILIANIRPYLNKVWQADKAGTASNDVLVVRPSNTVDPCFLGLVLANDTFISFVMAGAKGVKMPRGDITLIKQFPIPIPAQREEQQRIADCLSSLDEVIEFQAQKLEALKAHKKGLMKLLFPRKGETTPRLRFPTFRDAEEWEVKRLGEICSAFSGGTPISSRKEYYGGSIPFIRSAEINQDTTELFLTEEGLKNSSAKLVVKGDILVALYGANSGDGALSKIDGAINQAILCLRSKFNHLFILDYWRLRKNEIVMRFIQGGQGNLSAEIVKSIAFAFPSLPEQQKIADFFSSLDEIIDLQAQKLEAFKTHKKGLMQQLFPQEVGIE